MFTPPLLYQVTKIKWFTHIQLMKASACCITKPDWWIDSTGCAKNWWHLSHKEMLKKIEARHYTYYRFIHQSKYLPKSKDFYPHSFVKNNSTYKIYWIRMCAWMRMWDLANQKLPHNFVRTIQCLQHNSNSN